MTRETEVVAGPPRRSVLRDASQYTGATYLTQVGSFVLGLITKGLLGPTNVGVWSLLNILLGYLAIVQIGTGDAVAKEVPYLRSKGEPEAARRLGDAMLGFVLTLSMAVAAVVVGLTLWRAGRLSREFFTGLLLVGVMFPLWMYVNMQTVIFRAAKRFDVLSQQLVIQLAITALVGVPLMWRFSIYGQYGAFVATFLVLVVFLRRASRRDPEAQFRPTLDRGSTRKLLAIGLPLQLSGLVFTFQATADSLLAAKYLGVTSLGLYSIAVTVKGYVYQTPNAFSMVMFPRFQEKFAASRDDPAALRDYVEKPITGFAFLVLPLLIGASWQIVPFVIRHWLGAFIPAIPAVKILLVGAFFASLWHMPGQFLIAVNKLWHNVALAAGNAALVAVSVAVALRLNRSVAAVAVGTAAAYGVASLVSIAYAVSHFRSAQYTTRFLLEIIGAGAALFALLLGGDALLPARPGLGPDLWRLATRSAILLVTAAPLFWRAERAVQLLPRLRRRATTT